MGMPGDLDQVSARGYEDGTESGSSPIAAQSANFSRATGTANLWLMRHEFEETASGEVLNVQPQIQYNRNGGGWNDITASSLVAQITGGTPTDGDDTTERLTASSGTFITPNAAYDDVDGLSGEANEIDFSGTEKCESLHCIYFVDADVNDGDTVQFRVLDGSTVFAAYTFAGITVTVIKAAFDLKASRGRNDDGSEILATYKAAQNTDWEQALDVNFRIRAEIQETGGVATIDSEFQLQYNLELAGWNDVNASSLVARSSASSEFADGDNTTENSHDLTAGTGTFQGGDGMDEVNGLAGGPLMDIAASGHAEVEYCLQLRSADLDAGAYTIQFRIVKGGGTVLEAYTHAGPTVTTPTPTDQNFRDLDDTLASVSDVRIRGMVLEPGAGNYLLWFTGTVECDSTADKELDLSVYVDGVRNTTYIRRFTMEGSQYQNETTTVCIVASIPSVGAGEDVEIKWKSNDAGVTITIHERTFVLIPITASNLKTAAATADTTTISATDELMNSMTITDPGVGDWLCFFSSTFAHSDTVTKRDILPSIYNAGSLVTDSDVAHGFDDLINPAAFMSAITAAYTNVAGSTDDLQAFWRTDGATATARERALLALKNSTGNTNTVATSVNAVITAAGYTLITSMAITPGAGDWFVWFHSSGLWDVDSSGHEIAVHVNGVLVPHTVRRMSGDAGSIFDFEGYSIGCLVKDVGASEVVDIRAHSDGTTQLTFREKFLAVFQVDAAEVAPFPPFFPFPQVLQR